jgi:hypothetical protein
MPYSNPLDNLFDRDSDVPALSPIYNPAFPNSIVLPGAQNSAKLFSRARFRLSLGRSGRKELLQDVFQKGCMLKVKADIADGFDVSMALYPSELEPAAWGIMIDRAGRIFEANSEKEGLLEFVYRGGSCNGHEDWMRIVASKDPDERERVRHFYNKLRIMTSKRITLAGSVGFGLWDALWMAFDLRAGREILVNEPVLAQEVFEYWRQFHLSAVRGMLEAGLDIIFLRENPSGFLMAPEMGPLMDRFLGPHYRRITREVSDSGGVIFLDCDTDAMLETDLPLKWGFQGVGPMLFRDEEDLLAARRSVSGELILIGSTVLPEENWDCPSVESDPDPERLAVGSMNRLNPTVIL